MRVRKDMTRPLVRSHARPADLARTFGPSEIADYLIAHGGPDAKGRAFPTRNRLQGWTLEAALRLAREKGLNPRWQVYHFANSFGMWSNPKDVDAVILKKFEQVLRQSYGGNVIRMIQQTDNAELFKKPLVERICGRVIYVKMTMIYNHPEIRWSAFRMIQRALRLKISLEKHPEKKKFLQAVLRDVRPEHMARACRNAWDLSTKNRVLRGKVEQVMARRPYRGNILKMILNTRTAELLLSPFFDTVAGKKVQVKTNRVYKDPGIRTSPFLFIRRYLELVIGDPRKKKRHALLGEILRDLKPEHLAEAPKNTWTEKTKSRVLVAKVRSVMAITGTPDVRALSKIRGISGLLFSPLIETIAGHPTRVKMGSIRADGRVKKRVSGLLRWYREITQ